MSLKSLKTVFPETLQCHLKSISKNRIAGVTAGSRPYCDVLGHKERESLEELHIFIVLLLTYCTFKSRKIIKLLSDMDLVNHCDKMIWKESFT